MLTNNAQYALWDLIETRKLESLHASMYFTTNAYQDGPTNKLIVRTVEKT